MYVRYAPSRSDALVIARALLSYAEGGLRRVPAVAPPAQSAQAHVMTGAVVLRHASQISSSLASRAHLEVLAVSRLPASSRESRTAPCALL